MNKIEFQEVAERLSKKREEMLPKYLEIMNEYFPEHMCSALDRFKKFSFLGKIYEDKERFTEEEWEKEYRSYQKYGSDFEDDFRDPQTAEFYSLFDYDMLWDDENDFPHKDFIKTFGSLMGVYGSCKTFIETGEIPESVKDTEVLHFNDETVVITDPCYVEREGDDFWNFYTNKNIDNFIMRSTLYGDWSCHTINIDTEEELGTFCADAGMVAVFKLKELERYNKEKADWCKESWCATVIPNFTGDVQIKVGISEGKYYEFYCYVEGRGNINFRGFQTGF